jgi:phosphatidylglycerophosphate synthase
MPDACGYGKISTEMGSSESVNAIGARRPIKARESRWASVSAIWLARHGVSPNAISLASIAFSLLAGGAICVTRWTGDHRLITGMFLLAVVGIQGRLICNLLDGMVAIEGAKASNSGELFNDIPDRIADPVILIATGFVAGGAYGLTLGWTAALLAVMTAYVRVLGRSIRGGVHFIGPMAKQHRMAILTLACLMNSLLNWWDLQRDVLSIALLLIVVGCIVTIARRIKRIVHDLEAR